jgi:hypothetical protein
MGTPAPSPTVSSANGSTDIPDGAPAPSGADPLADLEPIFMALTKRNRQSAEHSAEVIDAQKQFLDEFARVCTTEIRPAMETVLERIRHFGGGGMIEEHPGGEPRVPNPRLTMWISLDGEIVGTPRPDRHAYLELDAEVVPLTVSVSEGDMWLGAGGCRSGRIAEWQMSDLNAGRVTAELMGIVRRAAA